MRITKRAMERYYVCPVCHTVYSLRRAGSRCGDLSQGQRRPCVGRVIPREQFDAAEWRGSIDEWLKVAIDRWLAAQELHA